MVWVSVRVSIRIRLRVRVRFRVRIRLNVRINPSVRLHVRIRVRVRIRINVRITAPCLVAKISHLFFLSCFEPISSSRHSAFSPLFLSHVSPLFSPAPALGPQT